MSNSVPTVSQAEQWRPAVLADVGANWAALSQKLDGGHAVLARQDHTIWVGAAATEAWRQLEVQSRQAGDLAAALRAAADAACRGALGCLAAQTEVLDLLAQLRAQGCRVSDDGLVLSVGTSETLAPAALLGAELRAALGRLGAADIAVANDIAAALTPRAPATPAPRLPAPASTVTEIVQSWPTMPQDSIAAQVAAMTPEQRQQLIEQAPLQAGNTDGVPWDVRIAANRINIATAITDQQLILDMPDEDKIRAVIDQGFGIGMGAGGLSLAALTAPQRHAVVAANPTLRAAALTAHDWQANQRIDFYRGLLAKVDDPTKRTTDKIDRQILAFDPARSSLIELHGDLQSASSLGVLVPGMNTTVLESDSNTKAARRFVAEGRGEVAMITYLGGPFPTGADLPSALLQASQGHYATDMAPRLVAFSEDVNRTVDATGRYLPVTYLGHSYGGSILGTAERLGLTADRTVYVEAAGAGVGVDDSSDWNNRNPDVERYSMTAPGDPIALVQGIPGGPHGVDPDEMNGVWRLPTGRRLDGSEMSGWDSHGDVVDEPSDAWRSLLAVITGKR